MFRSSVLTNAPMIRFYRLYPLRAFSISVAVLACMIMFGSSTPGKNVAHTRAAQTFRGAIVGTVTDVNGGAIPDAAVRARNVSTGLERATITDSSGNYEIPELPIGTYEVTVIKPNFAAARVTSVRVQ